MSITSPRRTSIDLNDIPVMDELEYDLVELRRLMKESWTSGVFGYNGKYCLVGGVEHITMDRTYHGSDEPDWFEKLPLALKVPVGVGVLVGVGAVYSYQLATNPRYRRSIRALKEAAGVSTVIGLLNYNDSRGQAAVVRVVDKAINNTRNR